MREFMDGALKGLQSTAICIERDNMLDVRQGTRWALVINEIYPIGVKNENYHSCKMEGFWALFMYLITNKGIFSIPNLCDTRDWTRGEAIK